MRESARRAKRERKRERERQMGREGRREAEIDIYTREENIDGKIEVMVENGIGTIHRNKERMIFIH